VSLDLTFQKLCVLITEPICVCCKCLTTTTCLSLQQPTPWSRSLPEKLIGPQLLKKLPAFMQPKSSLPYSQQPANCSYPEPERSSLRPTLHFFKIHFNIVLPSTPGFFKWSPSLRFPTKTLYAPLLSPYVLRAHHLQSS
jgi:hypothetical protein